MLCHTLLCYALLILLKYYVIKVRYYLGQCYGHPDTLMADRVGRSVSASPSKAMGINRIIPRSTEGGGGGAGVSLAESR